MDDFSDGSALVLRTVDADMTSRRGFVWPTSGPVECPDWNSKPVCGRGLHGLLWGEGDGSLLDWSFDAKWLVVRIGDYVDLRGKVKFQRGNVVHCGDQKSATEFIAGRLTRTAAIVGITLTGGDRSTLTGGYGSTLAGGYGSTLTGGDRSTLTGGDRSTLTGGYGSTLTGGDRSTLTGGNVAMLTGGYGATLTGGYGATLIFSGCGSRTAVVGKNGIRPNVPYRLNASFEIVGVT